MTDRAVAGDPMRWHFHPIITPRAHEEVVGQIAFAILSGAYAPNERLPHIEKLSSSMNVSKPVIGEALKLLAKAGVVQTRRGANGGLTVTTNQVPDEIMTLMAPLRHLGVQEIVEARHPIELRLALLAAERASESDFTVMQSCIDELRAHKHSELAVRIRFDHLFHYTIGRTAKSSVLALYQHQILEHLFVRMRSYFTDIEDVDDVVTVHQQTLEAIRSGNRARIVAAIADHLRPLELAVAAMQAGAGPAWRRTRAKAEGAGRQQQKGKEQNI
jgi:GntR family transcriptional regulator, transcriptional repressor for pyruvate dehydrogenase complex